MRALLAILIVVALLAFGFAVFDWAERAAGLRE